MADELLAGLQTGPQRTVHQDVPFGLQQIVDIALKALSPGINDPTTAVTCIDQVGASMASMAGRECAGPYRRRQGRLRVIAEAPEFDSMLAPACAAITDHAGDHVEIDARLLRSLTQVEQATTDAACQRLFLAEGPPSPALIPRDDLDRPAGNDQFLKSDRSMVLPMAA